MEWDICGRSGNDAGNIDRCSDFGTCGSFTSWSLLPEPFKTYAETASGLPGNRHSRFSTMKETQESKLENTLQRLLNQAEKKEVQAKKERDEVAALLFRSLLTS